MSKIHKKTIYINTSIIVAKGLATKPDFGLCSGNLAYNGNKATSAHSGSHTSNFRNESFNSHTTTPTAVRDIVYLI